MTTVRFSTEAEAELRDIRDHYEECLVGLGTEFVAQVEAGISCFRRHPELFGIFRATKVRVCPLRRFPYSLFYLPLGDVPWIVAVGHHRRPPDIGRTASKSFSTSSE